MIEKGQGRKTHLECNRWEVRCANCGKVDVHVSHEGDGTDREGVLVGPFPDWRRVPRPLLSFGEDAWVCSKACALAVVVADVEESYR